MQVELSNPAAETARGVAHPYYIRLNEVLIRDRFDAFVELVCAPYFEDGDWPGIRLGGYFRMLLVGYFEGLDNQRAIAWRCAGSPALRHFVGVGLTEAALVHASMTLIRQRLPEGVFDEVFRWVLGRLAQRGMLEGPNSPRGCRHA